MKKVLSAAIALTAVAAMSVSALAIDPGATNGSADGTADATGKVETSVATIEGLNEGDKVTVVVEAVSTVEDAVQTAVEGEAGKGTKVNTSVTITGVTLGDGQTATVTVAYDGASNKVVYVSDDGETVEVIDLTVSDDKKTASFKTTHFSTFYLVTVPEVGTPGDDEGDDKNEPTGVVLAIVPAAVAAAAVVVSKKRK